MPMQPGSPQAKMPASEDALIRRIQEIERVQREILPSVAASFGPVVADLAAKDVTILGLIEDLAAKDVQILDLIASVVTPDSGFATASTFAIPAGQANRVTRASFTLTVPNGCTSALVQAIGSVGAWNTGGSTDYLFSYLEIGPTPAWTLSGSSTCLNGAVTETNAFRNVLIEGLSGGYPIVIKVQPYTSVNTWPSSEPNSVTVSATC